VSGIRSPDRRRARAAAVLVGVALVVGGCRAGDTTAPTGRSPAPAPSVRAGGTLTYASGQKLTGFNQHSPASASAFLYNLMTQVWPSTFNSAPDGQRVLNRELLLSAEQTSSSPQTVVYRIDRRAAWSDGDPLDGRDFVYLWRTAYTKGAKDIDGSEIAATAVSAQGVIESVSLSDDDRTVTVVFARPYPDWQSLFALLVPSHIAERVGWNRGFNEFDPAVVVSGGPFRIAGYRPDQDVTLVRNERYWERPANLDAIVIRILPDVGQLLPAMSNREIDLANLTNPSTDLVTQARTVPGLTVAFYELARYDRLHFNFRNDLLAMPEVRRAIALALDRPAILARLNGQLDPAKAKISNSRLYSPGERGYEDTSGGRYDRADPAGARRLLETAGFVRSADGIYARDSARMSFRILQQARVDELIQAQLREVGIEVRIQSSPNVVDAQRRGDFDLTVASRPTGAGGKAGETSQFLTGGAFNLGRYSNPAVDDLISLANSELDEARRQSLYLRADQVMWDDMPTLPLQQAIGVVIHRDTFSNIVPEIAGGLFVSANHWGLR